MEWIPWGLGKSIQLFQLERIRQKIYTHLENGKNVSHNNILPIYGRIHMEMCSCVIEVRKPSCVWSHFRRVWLCATLWTVACQAPLSMGFSRQEYWSELPCFPPGDLPDPKIKPTSFKSPALQADSLPTEPPALSLNLPAITVRSPRARDV